MESWVAQYIGIPFVSKGRSLEGWDCWGLVLHVLEKHYGKKLIEVDDYDDAVKAEAIGPLFTKLKPLVPAARIVDPQSGDVVLYRFRGNACHTGVCVGDGMVLHVIPRIGTIIEHMDSVRMKGRVEGVYRVL